MRYITLAGALALIGLELTGSIPKSSVGGPMVLFLVFLVTALAAGIYEAWSTRRGVLGWIVSMFAAVVGGLIGAFVGGGILMSAILATVKLNGSLASSGHPALYVLEVGQLIFAMFGAWLMLSLVNRFR